MLLFVGLGNPGPKYARHRHNVGFMAVDAIARAHGFGPWRRKFNAEVAEGRLGGARVMLMKPMTWMNNSGQAVGEAVRWLKIAPRDVWVFHDDLDLAPGKVRVKRGGGHAGHNGLRSIHEHIGPDYNRVRIGIGHPGAKEKVTGWVLHDFSRAEEEWLEPLLDAIAREAPRLAAGDSSGFMNAVALALRPIRPPAPEDEPRRVKGDTALHARSKKRPETMPNADAPTGDADPDPDRGPSPPAGPLARLLARFGRG